MQDIKFKEKLKKQNQKQLEVVLIKDEVKRYLSNVLQGNKRLSIWLFESWL